ncbi:fungal zn(2)-Cys(6) binuclear cluster domain-containing protein [Rhizoctonia solani AG-1 IA]|uniref:Fungal zn(2)-Cys(6) binuclear cluster domain-containing protein n=1 Tax=Thanatephorus cucumeris (strain AG1-IA) TaxID=983506 RepID=L8WWL1_THACA|nr:fungal zn(2)-Cys(6) binuclear cluster domain-containing protein [Rhizoctonia solani AG-1 IA]
MEIPVAHAVTSQHLQVPAWSRYTRHKKCDKRKPACERCSKGGYTCLGYKHKGSNGTNNAWLSDVTSGISLSQLPEGSSNSVLPSLPYATKTNSPPGAGVSVLDGAVPETWTENCYHRLGNATATQPKMVEKALPQSLTSESQQDTSCLFSWYDDNSLIYDTLVPARPATDTQLLQPLRVGNPAPFQQSSLEWEQSRLALVSEIPKGISVIPSDIRNIVDDLQDDRVCNTIYFNPQDDSVEGMRKVVVWRLSTCDFARRGMLIDAKIRDSVFERSDSGRRSEFIHWIERFEQALCIQFTRPTTSEELRERLIDSLESIILSATATPTGHTNTVSIAHLLESPLYKCTDYMFMDIVGSMVYGLPQVLEYNTDADLSCTRIHPVELLNCLPRRILVILAKINAYQYHGVGNWQELEQSLVCWEPRSGFEPKGLESWKSIAWVALQEIWRHVFARTDDPRIKSSLRQVFQLLGIIRRQDPPINNPHLFAPYLIRRRLVRERLSSAVETRSWSFRSPDFVPVLDHLWLGAGLGGQPVTWNDYVYSSQRWIVIAQDIVQLNIGLGCAMSNDV